jgi:hypothetical protein
LAAGEGSVVETIVGDQAAAEIHMLAEKYIGRKPCPWRSSGERHVTFLIEPTHFFTMGG